MWTATWAETAKKARGVLVAEGKNPLIFRELSRKVKYV
jgi:hypothetical protein